MTTLYDNIISELKKHKLEDDVNNNLSEIVDVAHDLNKLCELINIKQLGRCWKYIEDTYGKGNIIVRHDNEYEIQDIYKECYVFKDCSYRIQISVTNKSRGNRLFVFRFDKNYECIECYKFKERYGVKIQLNTIKIIQKN